MSLASSFRNGAGFFKRVIDYRSITTAALIQHNLPHIVVPLRPMEGRIVADDIGLSIDPARHAYYLPLLPQARDLVREGGGSFIVNDAGDPEFRICGLRIVPENVDDLATLHEIFARRLYELQDGREWFVLDVGANVGYSALYFGGVLGWEVLGYEPFPETYEIAKSNIIFNGLSGRIKLVNAGVSASTRKVSMAYNIAARTTNSLFGNLQPQRSTKDVSAEIELVDAIEAIKEATAAAVGRPLLVKLDCEGAEYDIVDRLAASGNMHRIEAMIVEYHFILPEHTAERIRTPLLASGFFLKTLWTGPQAEGLLAVRLAGA